MTIGNNIRSLRINNQMTQKELSEKLNVSSNTIRSWEYDIKAPSSSAVISLSKIFDVSSDRILGISNVSDTDDFSLTKKEMQLINDYRFLDSYGKTAVESICAVEKLRIKNETKFECNIKPSQSIAKRYIPKYYTPAAAGISVPLDGDEFEMILVDESTPNNADFAVNIQGDSMLPLIHDCDTIFVERTENLDIGDIGIFSVDGAIYCKQYYIDELHNLHLLSLNPDYQYSNVTVSKDSNHTVKCYGKVILDCKTKLPDYVSNGCVGGWYS